MSTAQEKWASMTTRERDAWVAEHVMGWTLADRRKMGWGCGPDVWFTGEDTDEPHSNPTHQEPLFTTDAAADYLVLKHVRETWGKEGAKPAAFNEALFNLWNVRGGRCGVWEPEEYRPGDYSHAAYLALTGSQQEQSDE